MDSPIKPGAKDGFLVAGTSPKAWMFFPLIFPQFIDFNSNYIVQFFILITTYVVLDFISLIAYAVLARKLIVWIKANPRTINTISACVLIIIAIIIAVIQKYWVLINIVAVITSVSE